MKFNIGDIVTPAMNDDFIRRQNLTHGKPYEVLGICRSEVDRNYFVVYFDNDAGKRDHLHESYFVLREEKS